MTLDTIIVIDFGGEQLRLNCGWSSSEEVVNMLKEHHLKELKAWLEVE